MKIAITGASSTGKTTLLEELMKTSFFLDKNFSTIHVDTRSIISEMGIRADGKDCSRDEMREFQWRLLKEKHEKELESDFFITDRSFLDLAAFWVSRDNFLDDETSSYTNECSTLAMNYDAHIFLPYGRIPFKEDGYRPKDPLLHQSVSDRIIGDLKRNELEYFVLQETDINKSTEIILNYLSKLNSSPRIVDIVR